MSAVININKSGSREDIGQDEDIEIKTLEEELQTAVNDSASFLTRCSDAYDTRYCLWAGQTADGKKRREALGKEPFPWEGASDTRIHIADEVISDNVTLMRSALSRAKIQAIPVESNDTTAAAAMTTFLNRLMTMELSEMIRIEIPLLLNFQETYGHSVLAITWDQEVRMRMAPLSLEEMKVAAQAGIQQGDQQAKMAMVIIDAISDETRDDEVAQYLMTVYPAMKLRQARKAVRELRLDGQTEVPHPQITKNMPCWTALRPFRDVFYPANTTCLATARWIAWREVISPGDLRARILTNDYDEDAVREAIDKRQDSSVLDSVRYDIGDSKVKVVDEMKSMIEVFCLYRRTTDAEGFTTIRVSEFTPGCSMKYKNDEEQHYAHSEYPFVEFVSRRTERILTENRGTTELCNTQQTEIKTQRDYRSDRSSISILPPVKVSASRPNFKLTFGPATQIPVRKSDDVEWMVPPRPDAETVEIEREIKLDINNYFGRWAEGVHPTRQQLYTQNLTDDFLGAMRKVAQQTVTLCRQYLTNEEFANITGVPLPFAIDDSMPVMDFNIMIDFNAGDLNFELTLAKLKTINEVILPADTMGVIDRAKYIQWGMRAVDPTLAEDIIMPQEQAANQEITDEQAQFAKLFAGTEPEMQPAGQNFALRLQTLQGILQRNPNVQKRYAVDQIFKAMMDTRMKHFQFQLDQQKNAQIGRVGAAPALDKMNEQGLGAPAGGNGASPSPDLGGG